MSINADRRQFRFSFSFIARAMLVVLVVWALTSAVWIARDIVFIAFLGILFALFLSIFVDWLESYIPRTLATLAVVLAFLGLLVGFFFLAWPSLEEQIATLRQDVPPIVEGISDWVQDQVQAVSGDESVEADLTRQLNERMTTEVAGMVAGALPLLNTVLGALGGVLVVIFAGIFLTVSPRQYLDGFIRLVPPRGRDRLRDALLETGGHLRRWIMGVLASMLIIFLLTTVGLWLLGVPAFLALGVIAGLLEFIPFVGPILAAVPAVALGLTVSPLMALWVTIFYIGIQSLESNAITPLVMRKAVYLPPALTILFQMAMAVLFGFIGLVVAVPLLAAARILVQRLYVDQLEAEETPAR